MIILSMDYTEYLHSEHWRKLRRAKLEQCNYKCEKCDSRVLLEIHHKRYKNLFNCNIWDLECLCKYHHLKKHNLDTKGYHPYTSRETLQKLCGKPVKHKKFEVGMYEKDYAPPQKKKEVIKNFERVSNTKEIAEDLLKNFDIKVPFLFLKKCTSLQTWVFYLRDSFSILYKKENTIKYCAHYLQLKSKKEPIDTTLHVNDSINHLFRAALMEYYSLYIDWKRNLEKKVDISKKEV